MRCMADRPRRATTKRDDNPAADVRVERETTGADDKWAGRHRRVRLVDLLAYRDARRSERRATLDRMTEEAGGAGIYEGSPDDYAAALKAARKRRAK